MTYALYDSTLLTLLYSTLHSAFFFLLSTFCDTTRPGDWWRTAHHISTSWATTVAPSLCQPKPEGCEHFVRVPRPRISGARLPRSLSRASAGAETGTGWGVDVGAGAGARALRWKSGLGRPCSIGSAACSPPVGFSVVDDATCAIAPACLRRAAPRTSLTKT